MSNLFVKNDDKVDVKYFLYFDPNLPLMTFASRSETLVKENFDLFNKWLQKSEEEIQVEKKKVEEEMGGEIPEKPSTQMPVSENDSWTVVNGAQQMIWKEENLHSIHLRFRKPNHSDVGEMLSDSTVLEDSGFKVDINRYSDLRLRTLLSDWNLTDDDGNKVPITSQAIDSLNQKVFESMIRFMNEEIPTYL